jgi:hypothetical protein
MENLMKIGITLKIILFPDDIPQMWPVGELWNLSLLKPNKSANVLTNQLGSPLPEIRTRRQNKMSETNYGDEKMERSPFRDLK